MKLPDHAVGTVIHATLRNEDLIPAFVEFLRYMGKKHDCPAFQVARPDQTSGGIESRHR